MKRVAMTIGPQFAGKTTFGKKFVELFPGTRLVSLDEIRLKIAGTIYTEEDSFAELQAKYEFGRRVEQHIRTSDELLIFDVFFSSLDDMAHVVQSLRHRGADEVHAWHFVTPAETCIDWSRGRETDRRIPLDVKAARIAQYEELLKREYHVWRGLFDRVDLIDARDTVTIEALRTRLPGLRNS